MNKQDLTEFLTISYDKLVGMGACSEGLEWFAEHFGTKDQWPLGDVAEELRTTDQLEFLSWYVGKYKSLATYDVDEYWYDEFLTCHSPHCDAVCYAQYFATYYKIRELEELL